MIIIDLLLMLSDSSLGIIMNNLIVNERGFYSTDEPYRYYRLEKLRLNAVSNRMVKGFFASGQRAVWMLIR